MPLSSIKLPADDVRLITHEGTVYKVKLSYDTDNAGAFLPCSTTQLKNQVEQVLRVVLYAKPTDPLRIKTEHFHAECTFYDWAALQLISFKKNNVQLDAHPQVICIKFTPHRLCAVSHQKETRSQETVEHSAKRHKPDDNLHRTSATEVRIQEHTSQGQRSRDRRICEQHDSEIDVECQAVSTEQSRKGQRMSDVEPVSVREDESSMVEDIDRKKKACHPTLQFVESPTRVLRVNMGERVSLNDLHLGSCSRDDSYIKTRPRMAPRLAEKDPRKDNEGVRVIRKSPRLKHLEILPKRRSPRKHVSDVPLSSFHSAGERRKRNKSPEQNTKRRRSSFGKMIESFVDKFW